VARDGKQRSATVSAWQIDDGVGWEKTAAAPPRTVQVWYGPKPGDPVKPPERPGDLTGLDLDTIQVGGWWVGVPGRNGPPWLPQGREVWLSSQGDPVTGLAWQQATTQAIAGAESQVWLRQRVGGSWSPWRWQSGGLPAGVGGQEWSLPTDRVVTGTPWIPGMTVTLSTPVPLECVCFFRVGDATVEFAGVNHTILIGVDDGDVSSILSFNSAKPFDYQHTVFRQRIPAGTYTWRLWWGSGGGRFTGNTPIARLSVRPLKILDVEEAATITRSLVPFPTIPDGPGPQGAAPAPPVDPAVVI
jgi:hypothetical protein